MPDAGGGDGDGDGDADTDVDVDDIDCLFGLWLIVARLGNRYNNK